jgi:hypothetical protein
MAEISALRKQSFLVLSLDLRKRASGRFHSLVALAILIVLAVMAENRRMLPTTCDVF